MLYDSNTIDLRNQHPSAPTLAAIGFEPLHLCHQKLRQRPRRLRPLRLLVRQQHLQERLGVAKEGLARNFAADANEGSGSFQPRRGHIFLLEKSHLRRSSGVRKLQRLFLADVGKVTCVQLLDDATSLTTD